MYDLLVSWSTNSRAYRVPDYNIDRLGKVFGQHSCGPQPVSGELLILAPIPCVFCPCYNVGVRDLVILFVHAIVALSRLLCPVARKTSGSVDTVDFPCLGA